MRQATDRLVTLALPVVLGFLVGWVFTGQSWLTPSGSAPGGLTASDLGEDSLSEAPRDREWVLVYVGAASCPWSTLPGTDDLIEAVADSLRGRAETMDRAFHTIGVATDQDPEVGLSHLRSIASFDEVSVGRGRMNLGWVRYVSGDHRGPLVTPQLVLIDRRIRIGVGDARELRDEAVLRRVAGIPNIQAWVSAGVGVGGDSRR